MKTTNLLNHRFFQTPTYNETFEAVIYRVNGVLLATKEGQFHQIEIKFKSLKMSEMTYGFYGSSYKEGTDTHKLASSKFQPTFARLAFPCFDEPQFKTSFTVQLVHPRTGYIALSNMDQLGSDNMEDKTIANFRQSELMSVYLTEFIVCNFEVADSVKLVNGDKNTTLTVYMARGRKEYGQFAFETAKKITEFYVKYFDVEYPLPKLDLVAIPEYPTGATEHWGIITFRESALMLKKSESAARNWKSVASVISHELVHQWFGNLVTMKWWDDIWLNEGFASFIEYKGLKEAFSDWDIEDHFTVDDMHGVMVLDATTATRPIIKNAESPAEITALFDSIAYGKAASVIRMMEDMIGEEKFKTGVRNYLDKYKLKNTVTADFFAEFDALELPVDVK